TRYGCTPGGGYAPAREDGMARWSQSLHHGQVPGSCCKPDYDAAFDARSARRQLERYRREGARGSTQRLVDAITAAGVSEMSVLDVGGGIGIVGMELLDAGASIVTEVD